MNILRAVTVTLQLVWLGFLTVSSVWCPEQNTFRTLNLFPSSAQ
jgi:hypothetical protein